ncbi:MULTISPECIES: methyl-accepting chemotaxis protein [Marinobacter]|jgi:methyl-accepting chemotaxis protein|uniref:methyl-accepting chemotaxis protein n=1 Tax=Marinobacter TaxID=2742 RepID=UPI000FCA9235|nr:MULTISPECIES: methyl-accepting chemotaxis protein [Marinobacter]MCZ4285160.1 methyl-accepting chemotaxis protein [Marinobacter salarius]MDM8178305.1 methyl-accepting chemotaxis protein [Marinobacter salarius]RUT75068.1 methyl-accepting chemotaxis protein [Marinobacter sp. NP-6]VVT04360.1 Methyl-accepting chemotaxis protein [Marinobacter salarius]VXC18437.1 Methyl-accepting chemotaxis protein [Marinobacter salarius]
MRKISVIHRLYLGFGLLCVIIAGWGLFNGDMMTSISEGTSAVKERIFPFQRAVQAVEATTGGSGMAVISLARVRDNQELESRYGRLINKMTALDKQVTSLAAEAGEIRLLTGFEEPAQQYREALGTLQKQAARLSEHQAEVILVSESVNRDLSDFLAKASEMKQLLLREASAPAGSDIYLKDLLMTVMGNLSNIELLIMQLVSTDDAERLKAVVENLRFNTVTVEQDIEAIIGEIASLESLAPIASDFFESVNSEAGIVSQYYDYRSNLLAVNSTVADIEAGLDNLNSHIDRMVTAAGEAAVQTVDNLDATARFSEQLVYYLVPLILFIAVVISVWLGRLISIPLRATVNHLSAMAGGDYSRELTFRANGEFIELKESANKLAAAMREVLGSLQKAGGEITGVAASNADFSHDLSQRIRGQADDLNSIATAMTEMEASCHHVAESVRDTHQLVESVNSRVDESKETANANMECVNELEEQIQQTSGKLKKLESASHDIGRITESIDEIANQTNLLALNAAIESARAGEFGRGFAVVADEVRQLAQKTTSSTDTIRGLVNRLQGDAAEAVSSMEDSFQRLESVKSLITDASKGVETIREAVDQIRNSAEHVRTGMDEQEDVSRSVSRNVTEISGSSSENLAEIEQLVATSDQLKASMSDIEALIGRFRV